jgi:multidrug efflux pump subunit AcrB
MIKLTEYCLDHPTTTYVLTVLLVVGGIMSYTSMGRLEDPAFTIKDALVITPYPGASAAEVEEEVTNEIEVALQKLSQLKEIDSRSSRGLSIVTATMKDKYDKNLLPQVWDELRRKVGDAASNLPPGAGTPIVNDDFGDVYGIFIAVYGSEYNYAELWEVVKFLRRELLLVQDVAKIEIFGAQSEVVYVEISRERMSQLGVPPARVVEQLRDKNIVSDAGQVQVGSEFITISPHGLVDSVDDFGSLLIQGEPGGAQIYLRDIADIRRGYIDPASTLLRYDGNVSIGMGISTVADGNVVTMGEALMARMQELKSEIPLGIGFGKIAVQSDAVEIAIAGFVNSLLQAIAIVIVVLLFFMGLRSGLLIGFILFVTIAGSFIIMKLQGVTLERISLGALIIALGMLVDNAIVVVDGMLVRMQRGIDGRKAALEVVKQTAMPLLGATVIAVLAFAAIGTSQDKTGEFTRSLFTVVMISLMLSWVTAITITPLLGIRFLNPKVSEGDEDPYDTGFYNRFRGFLGTCIRYRFLTIGGVVALFVLSTANFSKVEQSFFPSSTRPQFMVDYWLPQGTHINRTTADVAEIEKYVAGLDGVTHVSSVIGAGALRFLLTYAPEKQNSAYGQLFVDVDDFKRINPLMDEIQAHLEANYPDAIPQVRKFILGPGEPGKLQAKFMGPDPDTLRELASRAEAILHQDPNAFGVRNDWRERVKMIRPILAEEQANLNGIRYRDVAGVLLQGFEGDVAGVFRDGDELLPIILRAPDSQRLDVASINSLQIWSPAAGRMIPLRQVVSDFETVFEDEIIWRQNRKRAITVLADPRVGEAAPLFERVRPKIEAIELPPGYTLEWWGEYKSTNDAREPLAASVPIFVLLMVLITLLLFDAFKQTAIIWLVVPLAMIGVTVGLLATGQPFGFMATLGLLSLIGMLIKNAIVLVDQIDLELAEGKDGWNAILDSAVSRLRPVAMAAATTILGMAPLFPDAFFVSMAVTIAVGLGFATVLTMVVVPVLYATFDRVKVPAGA